MKCVVVFTCVLIVASCVASAPTPYADASILKSESESIANGYKFSYETSDGSKHDEIGELKNVGTDDEALQVHGSYSFVGPDGQNYQVTFTADENGFQPKGAHLPHA